MSKQVAGGCGDHAERGWVLFVDRHTHGKNGRLPGVAALSPGADDLGGGGSIRASEGPAGGLGVPTWQCYRRPELRGGSRSICHVISLRRLDIFYNKV